MTPLRTVLTVDEVAAALKCGRTRVFELLAEGRLVRGVRLGRATVITVASVEALQGAQAGLPAPKRRRPARGDAIADAVRSISLTGERH